MISAVEDVVIESSERVLLSGLENQIGELVTQRRRLRVVDLWNLEQDDDCIQCAGDQQLIDSATADDPSEEEGLEDLDALLGSGEHLRALALTKKIATCAGVDNFAFFCAMRNLQRFVRL